jgi:hypothetical protein
MGCERRISRAAAWRFTWTHYVAAMAEFVLLPGAWLGSWAWDEVVPALRATGHGAHPMTLSGLAEKFSSTPLASAGSDPRRCVAWSTPGR